ncbi:MAG: glycosyltransferase family 39 protein [Bacteroidales bacterium]|nr:glycosyltransferase family 39 protein [Bacteroidales bacterium]
MKPKKELYPAIISLILMLGGVVYILFHQLGHLPLFPWDESRLAVNSYEMYREGFSLVPTFFYQPDMWNTKPPLLIWIQTGMFHMLGPTELALRIPSALSGVIICLLIWHYVRRSTGSLIAATFSGIIPVTIPGFFYFHTCRHGDYDALLTLLLVAAALTFFTYTQHQNKRGLFFTFVFITLATLTKSIVGLLIVPALIIWALMEQQLITILFRKQFWLGFLFFLLVTAAYYLGRELINPGYLNAVNLNELSGRYFETIEGHRGGFWFFLNNMATFQSPYWIWVVGGLSIPGLLSKERKVMKITAFSMVSIIVYLFVISISKTKLIWYTLPVFPFMAITAGTGLYSIWHFIKEKILPKRSLLASVLFVLSGASLLISPATRTFSGVPYLWTESWDHTFLEVEYFLREAIEGEHDLNNIHILRDKLAQRTVFYTHQLNDQNKNIQYLNKVPAIEPGQRVIVFNEQQMDSIMACYTFLYHEKRYHSFHFIEIEDYLCTHNQSIDYGATD